VIQNDELKRSIDILPALKDEDSKSIG